MFFSKVVFWLVMLFAGAHLHAAEVANVDLATADKTWFVKDNHGEWSEIKKDGEVSHRQTVPDPEGKSSSVLLLPAWWEKENLRPAEGKRFVVTIKYKDAISKPAWLASSSRTGSGFGHTYAGAFGGENDGQWKTIEIPLTWDFLSRNIFPLDPKRHAPGMTEISIRCAEAVPIASISIRETPGSTEEEMAYYAALREANRKVQTTVLKDNPYPAGKEGIESGQKVVAYPVSAYGLVMPNFKPKPEMIGKPMMVRMCLNEYEPGSFGVFANGQELKGVDYTVSALKNEKGEMLQAQIIPRTGEYTLIGRHQGKGKYTAIWAPNRFWPAYPVDIPANCSHWFLVDIKGERGKTKPGNYKGTVEITSSLGKASLPVEVRMEDVDLLTMNEANLTMGGSMSGMTPIRDIDSLLEYNQNSALLWYSGVAPGLLVKDGKLELDFTSLDDWMAAAKKRGIRRVVLFLGGDPYIFPYNLGVPLSLAAARGNAAGKKALIDELGKDPTKIPDSIRPLLVQWLKAFDAQAKEKGWPEINITPFDEQSKYAQNKKNDDPRPGLIGSGSYIKDIFIDYCKIIHETLPDMRIYASVHDEIRGKEQNCGTVFAEHLEVFCTNAIGRYPIQGERILEIRKNRIGAKRPLEFWQYAGVGVGDPGAMRFSFGFFFGGWGSTGSAIWGYNHGSNDFGSSGQDARLAWATAYQTILRPAYIGLREAWDDRRVIETYKKKFAGDPAAMEALEKILAEARKSQSAEKGGKDLVYDFWEAVDDVSKLDAWRNALLDKMTGK